MLTARQLRLGGGVELAAELSKGGHFTVLRQIQTQASGNLLHGAGLCRAPDAGDGQPNVDRRSHTRIEQIGFQINLPVGNRNHIGRNISRDVTRLRFNDRQRRERSGTELIAEFGSPLKQTRV